MDVLETYMKDTFGPHSFARVDSTTPSTQRFAAVQSFNAADSKAFVFLLAPRACGLGTQLPDIDVVVIIDSDWNARVDYQVWCGLCRK